MAKKSKGKSVTILVAVILILSAVGIFYYISKKPFAPAPTSLNVETPMGFEPEPLELPPAELQEQPEEVLTDSTPLPLPQEPLPEPQEQPATEPLAQVQAQPVSGENKPPFRFGNFASIFESDTEYWQLTPAQMEAFPTGVSEVVLVQNQTKLDYTIVPEKPADWVLARQGDRLRVVFHTEKEAQNDILSRKKQGKFAVQIISVESWRIRDAISLLERLVSDGYYAYIHRTSETYKGQHWYRVRVGTFVTEEDAHIKGKEIYYRYRDSLPFESDYWVVLPTDQELANVIVDLKTVRHNSWVVQIPAYSDWKEVLTDFDKLNQEFEFIYISRTVQKQTPLFQINLGLYETQEEARSQARVLKNIDPKFTELRFKNLSM